uniref:CASP-like protein n=1 Tax=Bursaphelenchus xylophilus TaxID=6326 RepID=A0A1I7SKI0_BURXY
MSAARKCRLPANVPGCPQMSQLPANVSAARKCDPPNFARKVAARKKFARKLVARKVVARKCLEFFLILFFFINSFLVSLQQKESYHYKQGDKTSDYVHVAFIITAACSALATICVLLMVIGVMKNVGGLLIPHMIIQ